MGNCFNKGWQRSPGARVGGGAPIWRSCSVRVVGPTHGPLRARGAPQDLATWARSMSARCVSAPAYHICTYAPPPYSPCTRPCTSPLQAPPCKIAPLVSMTTHVAHQLDVLCMCVGVQVGTSLGSYWGPGRVWQLWVTLGGPII